MGNTPEKGLDFFQKNNKENINHNKAFKYVKMSYDCNNFIAGMILGCFYKRGIGTVKNIVKGDRLIKECYDYCVEYEMHNNPYAQNNI